MKRQTHPQLSAAGELALTQYEQALREGAKLPDMSPLDLRHLYWLLGISVSINVRRR